MSSPKSKVQGPRSAIKLWTLDFGLWTLTALVVSALALRFAMRALGVRDDIAFPGLVYSLTAPIVEPFYRLFPLDARFDYRAVEVASLTAAGSVLALALGLYVVGLLLFGLKPPRRQDSIS